jgi:hypothetical protein
VKFVAFKPKSALRIGKGIIVCKFESSVHSSRGKRNAKVPIQPAKAGEGRLGEPDRIQRLHLQELAKTPRIGFNISRVDRLECEIHHSVFIIDESCSWIRFSLLGSEFPKANT